jgi:hypothetical protein
MIGFIGRLYYDSGVMSQYEWQNGESNKSVTQGSKNTNW